MANPQNPKYKFFQNELTKNEIPHYDNGKEIAFTPSTPELKECAERIIKALETRGFRRMAGFNHRSVSFSKPENCKAAYVGTFVNPCSFRDKVWNWVNHFAISEVIITLSEVYKHNGAANNASFRLSVNWSETKDKPKYFTTEWDDENAVNDYGIEIPSTYETVYVGGRMVKGQEIRKFKPSVSDKVLNNILDKAEEIFNGIEIFDPSVFEVDAKDFHESTHEEWKTWKEKAKAN